MELNTLAGRTFNDITQYPVFPWILRDYESPTIDLANPAVYRDLTRPMGALGAERAAQFRERYESVLEGARESGEEPDPPAFHYGTHYSCAGYVLYYLVRLEPFTRMALALQGGAFDKADRLFRDVRSSWESASAENLQDVRELIPEFYCLPEFLMNADGFDLGVTQRGSPVHHVRLPPWARGDAREFVRVQRRALESDHVSARLHAWVDLVFGHKQRGADAVRAQNVFVHLTYEGEVDLDAIDDALLREATLAQIHNFGQTPTRLFKRPHDARAPPPVVRADERGVRSVDAAAVAWHAPSTPPLCIVGHPAIAALRPVLLAGATTVGGAGSSSAYPGSNAVGDAKLARDRVVMVGTRCLLCPAPGSDEYVRFGGPSCGVAFYQIGGGGGGGVVASSKGGAAPDALLSAHDGLHARPITCAAYADSGAALATGGGDGALRVWSVAPSYYAGGGRTLELRGTLAAHAGAVACVDACEPFGVLVSGGACDARVLVWDLNRLAFLRELPGHRGRVTAVSVNRATGGAVTLASAELRVWGVNGDLLARWSAAQRRSLPTVAIATRCPHWQEGVVAVTGHDNGDVSLWGIQWSGAGGGGSGGGGSGGSSGSGAGCEETGSIMARTSIPPRDLVCRRVLNGAHTRAVTCVRVCDDQRELLVGDAKGVVSRWQCLRLADMSQGELRELMAA
ncbi:BEACH domain-containing protein [Tribonema minus]|uniref:BEACH domain-containing protein n=1 Tax=Tribonema minus TaxID=303371 RepID=A0A835YWR3_9STRA|nr:BEACH domain-containing protein [Tribonema minus]